MNLREREDSIPVLATVLLYRTRSNDLPGTPAGHMFYVTLRGLSILEFLVQMTGGVFPGFPQALSWEVNHLVGLTGGQGTVPYRGRRVDGAWVLNQGDGSEVGRNGVLSPHPFLFCCRIHWRQSILSFLWGLRAFHECRWHRTYTGWCLCQWVEYVVCDIENYVMLFSIWVVTQGPRGLKETPGRRCICTWANERHRWEWIQESLLTHTSPLKVLVTCDQTRCEATKWKIPGVNKRFVCFKRTSLISYCYSCVGNLVLPTEVPISMHTS